MTKEVNVEKGKQGFQPTVKAEATSEVPLSSFTANKPNVFGHFTDTEFAAVRGEVAAQFNRVARRIGAEFPGVSRVEFRVVQHYPGMNGYRIDYISCYYDENDGYEDDDYEDDDTNDAAYEYLCSALTNHTRSLLAEDTGLGVTDANGLTKFTIADPTEHLR